METRDLCLWIFLLVSLFMQETLVWGQKPTFNHVVLPEGKAAGTISGITQDPQGYMWFSSNQGGLFRYDGYTWKNYLPDPQSPDSLVDIWTESICADKNGSIWVGTMGKGLDKLDPETGIFKHFRHNPKDKTSLSNDTVTTILQDHEGILWVGTSGGLDRYNPQTGTFTNYSSIPNDTTSLSNNKVITIYEDRQGTLWIGCGSPWDQKSPPEAGGLNRFNRKTGKFTRYLHDPQNPNSLLHDKMRAILEDSRGNFWIGTVGDGLHRMNRATGTFQRFLYDPAHPEKLSKPHPKVNAAADWVTFIHEDASGAIWIGSFLGGINRYDPVTKQISRYENLSANTTGYQEIGNWAFTSREGVLWISTMEGNLYRLDPFRAVFPYTNLGEPVSAICAESAEVLWLGTENGLLRRNLRDGTTKRFLHDPNNAKTLSSNIIISLNKDKQGMLWIGTLTGGLNRLDLNTFTITRFLNDSNKTGNQDLKPVPVCYTDHSGTMWVGTSQGLLRFNKKNNSFRSYLPNPRDSTSISPGIITSIQEDKHHNLWIGTITSDIKGSLNYFNPQTGKFKHYLKNNNIWRIVIDTRREVWVGSEKGLFRYNSPSDNFLSFNDPSIGQPFPPIIAVLEDNKQYLWIAHLSGLSRLDFTRNHSSLYTSKYGINGGTFINLSANKGPNGEIFIGNRSGYFAFQPEKIKVNKTPPQIVLSAFRLFDNTIKPGKNSPLTTPLNQVQKIKLNYQENVFAFSFTGIHYSEPQENRLFYKLENFDNNWRMAGADHAASYFKVPPGNYIFKIKAITNDGAWSQRSISINLRPPWWNTWWAYGLYVLGLIGGIWILIEYRSRKWKQENKLLEEKVSERTAEVMAQKEALQQTLQHLKAAQTQLVQQEKLASLGELTAGIAHEIQNPLNFVNNFSEVNKELLGEIRQELKAGNEEEVLVLVDAIEQNLEKINNHGQRADAIVKNMLQHSRSSTGQKELTDINALAEEYLRLSYHGLRAKNKDFNAKLITHFDSSLNKVEVIPQELGRVLLNLYNNAFYATLVKKSQLNGHYEPEVTVRTCQQDGKVQIRVHDNGIGIPENVKNKIFQPFFTTKPTGQGTGLGLSLSYDIITKGHGGELMLESQEGEYTEFIVKVPISALPSNPITIINHDGFNDTSAV